MTLLRAILVFTFLLAPALAAASSLVLERSDAHEYIGAQLYWLEDPDGTLGVRDVRNGQWQRATEAVPSFGYTTSTYWFRLRLGTVNTQTTRYLLEVGYPVLDDIRAWVYYGEQPITELITGDRLPFAERPIAHPNFILPIPVRGNGPTDVYIRVKTTSSLQLPLSIYSQDALFEAKTTESVVSALFYGAMLVMTLYNLLLFISLRDMSFLYCGLSVLSMAALAASLEGLSYMYLWPDQVRFNDAALVLALSGMLFFPPLFFRSFLMLPQTRPVIARLLLLFAALSVLTAIGGFLLPYRIMIITTITIVLAAILTGFVAGILRWRDGFHAARYFNLAWIFMFLGGILLAMSKFNVLPSNWFTLHAGQLGATMEAALLSLALASRMNYNQRMRAKAQREKTQAQQALLEHQIRSNERLEKQVRERTAQLEDANRQLQTLSNTDSLTQLLNRRAFEAAFNNECRRAQRESTPLSLLMVDLDFFKKINDEHGHPFGDRCLVTAASTIARNLRQPPDLAGRYGGEEFIILLPGTDVRGAISVAEKIRAALSAQPVVDGPHQTRLTASIGVAGRAAGATATPEALIREADACLYQAKENGRNQVCTSDS